ncbi:MAG: hypothetical protein JWQ90_3669 [Hydrocarboniphaga sp.]|uniref:Crp/Fnr family transcriptional regulator n=1 Tax=Hydrocarboniphaga sp. TaxID=2033016 RepID=UPI002601D1F8|nr:Crp/Fnr family transcriptional regulator [Hydrocarboniphaga sp.]MDB5971219.1 hypothetical protein [Hydrocarboniphaga sp.]
MTCIARYQGGNRLLDTIPTAERDRVLQRCQPITVEQGETIGFPGEMIHYVYFPIDCVVSLSKPTSGQGPRAFALIGSDGVVGSAPVAGTATWRMRAKVLCGGNALWIRSGDFHVVLDQAPELKRRLDLCAAALLAQLEQAATCLAAHNPEQRLAYWLLMIQDCHRRDSYYATHEMLADIEGGSVRAVAAAAGRLRRSGLITDERGHIVILDRSGLERAACGCYRAVTDRILQIGSKEHTRQAATAGADPVGRQSLADV